MKISELMKVRSAINYLRHHALNRPYLDKIDQRMSLEACDLLDKLEEEIQTADCQINFVTTLQVSNDLKERS